MTMYKHIVIATDLTAENDDVVKKTPDESEGYVERTVL